MVGSFEAGSYNSSMRMIEGIFSNMIALNFGFSTGSRFVRRGYAVCYCSHQFKR